MLKQERIGDFIQAAREDIKVLWKQLYYSAEQKQPFQSTFDSKLIFVNLIPLINACF
jgi:hypothetical protein